MAREEIKAVPTMACRCRKVSLGIGFPPSRGFPRLPVLQLVFESQAKMGLDSMGKVW